MNAELKTADNYTFLTRGIFLFIAVIILIIADLLTGSVGLSFNDVKNNLFAENNNSLAWISLHEFRIPRVITAIVSGIALSVSGLQMQTVFRNPLAGPYVLGISSGSGLGVALLVVGLPGLFEFSVLESENNMLLILASWLGAATVLILILIVSFRLKNVMSILILGIMLGSGISAIINILQYFSRESALKAFVIWTMGSLGGVSSNQIPYLLLGFLPGILLAILIIKPSNAMLLGENYARSLGVRILPYRIMVFTSTALLTGTVTAFCGPIGFIGIAVPHMARMLTKTSRFGVLFFFSILLGTAIMLLSDMLSQLPGAEMILPLNAITSLIGIPVVIWIVLGKKRIFS